MDDTVFEISAGDQISEFDEILVVSDSVEGLIERGQSLLAIKNKEGRLMPVQRRAPENSRQAKRSPLLRILSRLPAG
jgi:hypothetical protein